MIKAMYILTYALLGLNTFLLITNFMAGAFGWALLAAICIGLNLSSLKQLMRNS